MFYRNHTYLFFILFFIIFTNPYKIRANLSEPEIIEEKSIKLGVDVGISLSEEGFCVVPSTGWKLQCYDLTTYEKVWEKGFKTHQETPAIIYNNIVFYPGGPKDKKCAGYDLYTGDELWVIDGIYGTSPAVIYEDNLFISTPNSIIKLNPLNGEIMSKMHLSDRIITKPVVINNAGYFTTLNGKLLAIDLENLELLYEENLGSPVYSSPAIYDTKIFIALYSGDIVFYNTIDKEIATILTNDFPVYADVITHKKTIYITYFNGDIYALDIDGNVRWVYKTISNIDPAPLIYNDSLIFGADDGYLRSINEEGKILWRLELGDEIKTTPVIYKDILISATMGGKLYFIKLP
jgi:outer membrane protein assembly factor BamB